MNEAIDIVENNLREKLYENNPVGAAEDKATLAGVYSFTTGKLINILQAKPDTWNKLRAGVKSDTAAERLWEAKMEGIEEMTLRLTIKRLEKMMSALSTIIKIAEGEANNQY